MKKHINIEISNQQALELEEMKLVNGGGWGDVIMFLISEYDDIKQGALDAYNGKPYKYNK